MIFWSEPHVAVLEPDLGGIRRVTDGQVGVNEKVRG